MVLDPSCNSVPFLVERAPANSTTTNLVLSPSSNLYSGGPINAGPLHPILLTSQSTLSSTGFKPTNDVLGVPTSSQAFTTLASQSSLQANTYPSNAVNGYLQQTSTPSPTLVSVGSQPLSSSTSSSLSSSSSITNSGSTGASTGSSSSTPLWSSLRPSSDSSSSDSSSPISIPTLSPLSSTPTMSSRVSSTSTTPDFTSSFTISPIPLSSTSLSSSFSVMSISTSAVVSTSAPTNSSLSADPSSSSDTASTFSSSAVPISGSTTTQFPTTLIVSTTQVDKYSTTPATTPWTSTLILTSILPGHSTTTWTTTTTSEVLSTAVIHTTGNRLSRSPGSIAGLVLGVLGAIAFAILWLFCARRRQRKISRDASAIPPWAPGGPLEAEVDMEERYAGILAALNAGMGAGRNARIEGDTSGEVSGELAIARASSPTLPRYSLPGEDNDGPHVFPLSPPPSAYTAPPPPSAYIPRASNGSRRRSSPGPDASAWFGGYSVAPAPSAASHYSHSTTHFLTRTETGTRTRTGSEEPLLTRAGSKSSYLDSGNRVRLGSAFGSPEGSMNGHNLSPTSPSSGMRSATTSSFDVLRSISSQGALRSTSSHGYGFGFGSTSSGTGSHQGPALGLAISAAPISYKSRSVTRWKKGKRESTGSSTTASASVSGSVDEKPAGVRAFLGRLRRANTPSPKAGFSRELPRDLQSEGAAEKMNAYGSDTTPQTFSAFLSPATPEPVPVPTSPRFVLSNPDPRPSSPYVHVDVAEHEDGLQPPAWPWLAVQSPLLPPFGHPSPAPTDESRLTTADGLLDPRLCDPVEGRSNTSLRDFEDYSRPIGGLINNRMRSTTTFGTVDTQDFDNETSVQNREDDQQEDACATATQIPRASWIIDGGADVHAH